MLSSICRGKAAAGIFLLKPRSKTSGNGGYITGVFLAAAYTAYIFLRFQKFRDFMMIYYAWATSSYNSCLRASSFIWNGPMLTLPAVVVWIVRGSRRGPIEPSTTLMSDAMSL